MERLINRKPYLLKIGAALGVVATTLGGCVINTAPEEGQDTPIQQDPTPSEESTPEITWKLEVQGYYSAQ